MTYFCHYCQRHKTGVPALVKPNRIGARNRQCQSCADRALRMATATEGEKRRRRWLINSR